MPVIKIDLSQEVLDKLATLANRNMVATRVMAVEIIEKHLAAEHSAHPTSEADDQTSEDWSSDNSRLNEAVSRFARG